MTFTWKKGLAFVSGILFFSSLIICFIIYKRKHPQFLKFENYDNYFFPHLNKAVQNYNLFEPNMIHSFEMTDDNQSTFRKFNRNYNDLYYPYWIVGYNKQNMNVPFKN